MRVVWTRRYLRELAAVGDYLLERNPAAAARIVRAIHGRTLRLLTQNAFLGRRGEIEGTRELVLADLGYIVAYVRRMIVLKFSMAPAPDPSSSSSPAPATPAPPPRP